MRRRRLRGLRLSGLGVLIVCELTFEMGDGVEVVGHLCKDEPLLVVVLAEDLSLAEVEFVADAEAM